MFQDNTADDAGGHIWTNEAARLYIDGALLTGGRAPAGGALAAGGNSTIALSNTIIQGARADILGGGLAASGGSVISMFNCVVTGCSSLVHGGGLFLGGSALLVLNSTVEHNIAGLNNMDGLGGGVYAAGGVITLDNSRLTSNRASDMGGGMALLGSAKLSLLGHNVVYNNTARTAGGGLRLGSDNFSLDQLLRHIRATGNKAPKSADMSSAVLQIAIVNSSNADTLIASDSKDGLLLVTLEVTGPHGVASDDDLTYTVEGAQGNKLYTARYVSAADSTLKQVPIRLKYPTGERARDCLLFLHGHATSERINMKSICLLCVSCSAGTYFLQFYDYTKDVFSKKLEITLVPCPKGYVTGGTNNTCNPCLQGFYSFTSANAQCIPCGPNQQCPGHATLWAVPGYFQSAPQSNQMHR